MTQFQYRNVRVGCADMECVNKYQRQLEAHLRRGHIGDINRFCLTQTIMRLDTYNKWPSL